jgi:hypothetical protein
MKKQLFIFVLVVIAAISSFGQAIHHSNPQPLVCTTGPLNPIAGVPYDYSATLNPDQGSAYWYATTSTTFINNGTRVATEEVVGGSFVKAATNYRDATAGDGSPSTTQITWDAAGLNTVTPAAPLFVVVDYTAPASTGCANNMKVYPIVPTNGFIVDIYNLNASFVPQTFGTTLSSCYSNIKSATYSGGAIVTDYGTNYLYYEVVAANFSSSWTPTLAISGLQTGQTGTVEWAYDNTFSTVYASGDPVNTLVTNTSTGVSIFVRVTVNNGTYEGLSNTSIVFTANGVSNGKPDVINTDCTQTSLTDDQSTQTLQARPTVTSVPAGTFITN